MKKIGLLLVLLFVSSAHAAQFIKINKSDAVIGYKEPTPQSKMLNVFKEGDVIEVVAEKDGWYKVKIPFNQGYFLYGWVLKNSPFITLSLPGEQASSPVMKNAEVKQEAPRKTKATGLTKPSDYGDDENPSNSARLFGGPVFSLHNYGAFQYRTGLSYEIPISGAFKLGIPVSYLTGDGFHSIMFGLESMYSLYFDWFALTPRLGVGFEYFYGNSKSFNAITLDFGPMIEVAVSKHFTVGIEPLTVQAMYWNSTDSINKVPSNIRGQSMILLRGRW